MKAGQSADYNIAPGRKVYLVPASGRVEVNGMVANAGDGVAVSDELMLHITARQESEIVMVDVA